MSERKRMSPEEAIAAQRLALQVEYGTYICGDAPIVIDGARAFNPGEAVPVSHVERGVVADEQVVKVKNPPKQTKAALAELVEDQKKDGA
jgi:hypothetical protein